MSKKQTNQEHAHKLSELITYYEVCNKAEGKTQKPSVGIRLIFINSVPMS